MNEKGEKKLKFEEGVSAKLKSFRAPNLRLDNLEIAIGKIAEPVEEERLEPMGPHPKASLEDIRDWDFTLLKQYKPFYSPFCDTCCLCTFGRCDLSGDKKGVCGMDIRGQQGRWSLLQAVIGTCTHLAHAKELVEKLIEEKGAEMPIDMGEKTPLSAPTILTITGIDVKKIGDLKEAIEYVESQIPHFVSSCHMGQESSYLDFESKALHAGMLDHLSMEIADIAQIATLGFPKADISPPLVEIGFASIDQTKPVILCIGHNVLPGRAILDYIEDKGLTDKIEVCGICCTAHDITRYRSKVAKIVGPISRQKKYVRAGIADVIVTDEQCIMVDILSEAKKVKTPLIATSNKALRGLPDRTKEPVDEIVKELLNGAPGVAILDEEKVGEVATRVTLEIAEKRKKYKLLPDIEKIKELAGKCIQCKECIRACPNSLDISSAMAAASEGDLSKLTEIEDSCLGCGRCENTCKRKIPILDIIMKASEKKIKEEKSVIRAGRGPISDYEIRMVADTWGVGVVPGAIAIVGCANYPGAAREVYEMAEELLNRGYIVVASGCAAMNIGLYKDEEGKSLYEKYHGIFDGGGMLNVGSCVSNPHIADAGIRVAKVFARRVLRGNYVEIADYLLNRIGACGIVWGTMSYKAFSIATGFNRLGVPVILGPHGSKYKRLYLGKKETKSTLYDPKTGEERKFNLVPEHLLTVAESKGEALAMATKLCMRNNDWEDGRKSKIGNYIDLSMKYLGKMPDDLDRWIRTERDVPSELKDTIKKDLKEKKWEPVQVDWDRMKDVSLLKKEELWTFEALRKGYRW